MDQSSHPVDAPTAKRQKLNDAAETDRRRWIVTLDRDDDTYKSKDRDPDSTIEGNFKCQADAQRAVKLLMIRDIEEQSNYDWNDFSDLPTAENLAHCHYRHGIPSQALLTAMYKFYLEESVVRPVWLPSRKVGRVTVSRDNCWKEFHDETLSPDHWDFEGLFELLFRGEFVPETHSYHISVSDVVEDMAIWEQRLEAGREFTIVDESLDEESSEEEEEDSEDSEDKIARES